MGWNSWDSYGLTVTEGQFRANVDVIRNKLKAFGWQYAVVDEGWYFVNPQDRPTPTRLQYAIDHHGLFVPVPVRFPSATPEQRPESLASEPSSIPTVVLETSFKTLGDWVHAQGLKFGIHIIRGIPKTSTEHNFTIEGTSFRAQDAADMADTCPWDPTSYGVKDKAAGQAWYDSLMRQYAAWGVDLLKVDCISDHPYKATEIRQIRRAIDRSGRAMVLSLSPGPTQLAHAGEVGEMANMWRISDDVWDRWQTSPGQPSSFPQTVRSQFARLAAWEPYAQPNRWPDGDMLPFGELKPSPGDGKPRTSRLTLDEERAQLTLWAIARSPLILGANLTLLDAPTLAMLTNADVIRVNQRATHSEQVLQEGDLTVWRADLPGGEKALALFNLGEGEMTLTKQLGELGKDLGGKDWSVRNIWGGGVAVSGHEFAERIPAHGCVLLLLTRGSA